MTVKRLCATGCVCEMITCGRCRCRVSAAGVHLRASGARPARGTDSGERGQQGHQLQPSQTAHRLRHHVVARRSA